MVAFDTINSSIQALKQLKGPFTEQPGVRNLQREALVRVLSHFVLGFQTLPPSITVDDERYQSEKRIVAVAYNNLKDALQHTKPPTAFLSNIRAIVDYGDKVLDLALKDAQISARTIGQRKSA